MASLSHLSRSSPWSRLAVTLECRHDERLLKTWFRAGSYKSASFTLFEVRASIIWEPLLERTSTYLNPLHKSR